MSSPPVHEEETTLTDKVLRTGITNGITNDNAIEMNNFKQTKFDGDIHAHSVSNILVFFIYSCTSLNSVRLLVLLSVSFPNNNSWMLSGWMLNASKNIRRSFLY